MRVYCLRRKVRPGDRLVLRLGEREFVTADPVQTPGEEGAVLTTGEYVPYPAGKGLEVERD